MTRTQYMTPMIPTFLFVSGCVGIVAAAQADRPLAPKVEVEASLYTYEPANNGAGPLWCYGSTCLVRVGQDVFASGLETLPGAKPLHNVRWTLYRRTEDGWKLQQKDEQGRTREPCPLVCFPHGRLFASVLRHGVSRGVRIVALRGHHGRQHRRADFVSPCRGIIPWAARRPARFRWSRASGNGDPGR